MEIIKETVTTFKDSDGLNIEDGDLLIMDVGGNEILGYYMGITERGMVKLRGLLGTVRNIRPANIKKIRKLDTIMKE